MIKEYPVKLRVSIRKRSPLSQEQDKDANLTTSVLHFTEESSQGNKKRKGMKNMKTKKEN